MIKGKKYGPYYYKSYREGGRVKKLYISPEELKSSNLINFGRVKSLVLSLLILIVLLVTFIFITTLELEGKISLDVQASYSPGEKIFGGINITINEGELIPAGSKLSAVIGNQSAEILLSEIASANIIDGDYYADGANLIGSGSGYGLIGEKESYPEVSFELLVFDEYDSTINSSVSGSVSKGNDFVYSLGENKTAEIVAGSIKVNEDTIGDDLVSLQIEGNEARVSTSYSIIEEGFGEEFLGCDFIVLNIDLNALNLTAENGTLSIDLSYNEEVIASALAEIVVDDALEENVTNQTSEGNQTAGNQTSDNQQQANITTWNISLLKNIPAINVSKNGNYSLNLSEYFKGASSYSFTGANASATFANKIAVIKPANNFVGTAKGKITAHNGTASKESNEFLIIVLAPQLRISTSRESIIKVGQPVKWVTNITLDAPDIINITLPGGADNIVVKKIEGNVEQIARAQIVPVTLNTIVTNVCMEIELRKEPKVVQWMSILRAKIKKLITGKAVLTEEAEAISVIVNENATKYSIEYYTDAPRVFESIEAYGKKVIVSGPSDLDYTNILTFTNIPETLNTGQESRIKVYWEEGGKDVDFFAKDLNVNGKLDYIEWFTPHLSNQTFRVIIPTGITQTRNLTTQDAGQSDEDFEADFEMDFSEENTSILFNIGNVQIKKEHVIWGGAFVIVVLTAFLLKKKGIFNNFSQKSSKKLKKTKQKKRKR